MFNDDFTDFESQQWNGWVAESDLALQIAPTPDGHCLELSRNAQHGQHRFLHKRMTGLRPGQRYLVRLQARERDDRGPGIQRLGFCIDGDGPYWHQVKGHDWRQLSQAFTATSDSHDVSLFYDHQRSGLSEWGNYHLDDLRFYVPQQSLDDLTDFEQSPDPLNSWYRDANGGMLGVLADTDGSHYIGHATPTSAVTKGRVLTKRFNELGQGHPGTFSLRARKPWCSPETNVVLDIEYAGQSLGRRELSSSEWQNFEWSLETVGGSNVSVAVHEQWDLYAAGLWIDSLLVGELYEEVTDFSGIGAGEQFNGWELDSRTSDRVVVVHDSAAEGNALNFPTHPGFKHDGIILFKTFAGLLAGARFEFIMRVRSNNNIDNARLSATFDEDSVMGETVIRNLQWQPRDEEPRYKGQFTVSNGPQVLRIYNSNPASRGNDYRFSELIVRRIDLDE
ncbi:hypothetical protein [Pseudomonas xanthosomatis]|uniref:hypothetical protein n=1 Tax=Pseudomonas xanthosomatis TaxID=2842356 RepID=UPI003513A7AB